MAHDLFKRFFSISHDLFVVTNGCGRIEHVNPRWETLLGYRPDEAEGRDIWSFVHPNDLVRLREVREMLYSEEVRTKAFHFESRVLHKGGATVYLSWTGSIDPVTKYFYGTAKDLTEEKSAENELGRNRRLLDAFMQHSTSLMYVKDREGRYVLVNKRFEHELRHVSKEFIGKRVQDMFPAKISESLWENELEIFRTGIAKTFEERMIRDGGTHTYVSSKFPVFDANGEIAGIGGISTDITDLVQEREASGILRQMIESAKDGFGYCGLDLKPVYLNRYLTEHLGWTIGQTSIFSHLSPATVELISNEALPRILEQGLAWESEVNLLNERSGEILPVWLKMFCSYSEEGSPRYIGFFAADLTNKKAAEAAIIQNSKMASLGEMAAGVAHEVNNPVTIIHGTAALLKKAISGGELDAAKITAGLERIEKTAMRISRTIRGLRTFSRSGQNDPPVPTRLVEIFADTIDLCQERFRNHAIDLRIGAIPDISFRCRPTQITQVLLNLLSNASDAVAEAEKKWIQITFEQTSTQRLRISISDSGPGIPHSVRKRLMEPFFTTKAPGQGTGLGLPISQGIIQEHPGSLTFDDEAPHTCFIIEIPVS